MVTNLQMIAYFLNVLSIKHYWVQYYAKFGASIANIKSMGVLQTLRQFWNETNLTQFSHIVA